MNKIYLNLFVLILPFILGGCATYNEAIALQDQYASGFSISYSNEIVLNENHTPIITRGIIPTDFFAKVPAGVYIPIASSSGRNFYQAPFGFKYMKNGIVKSRVGGIVQMKKDDNSNFYIWYFPDEIEYYEVQPNGEWIHDVKPGLSNILTRPWIEGDLKVHSEN